MLSLIHSTFCFLFVYTGIMFPIIDYNEGYSTG